MEGITGVVHSDHVTPTHTEYQRFRRLMTADVNAAVRGAFLGGAGSVTVTDAHWSGLNILMEELDPRATLIAGMPQPYTMISGIENADALMLVGYHGKVNTPNSILDHTYSSSQLALVAMNDMPIGEAGLNGLLAGSFGVPVIMASGDNTLCDEVREFFGEAIEVAEVKKAMGRMEAECLAPSLSVALIEEASQKAIRKFYEEQSTAPYCVNAPIKLTMEFKNSLMADRTVLMEGVVRLSGHRVEVMAKDARDFYAKCRLLLSLSK